jgi:TonB dependent receptor/Carboxypeptidase regulatory-like domain
MLTRLSLLLLLAAPTFGQSTLDVRITDRNGDPVPSAAVTLKHSGAETHGSRSGPGEFRFLALPSGEYEISATADGYFSSESEVVVKPRQPVSVQIELAQRTAAKESVEVESADITLGETSSSRLLTHAEVAALPSYAKRDIPTLALYNFPGATMSHDNYVHVRGNEVSLQEFINGVSFLENPQQQFSPGLTPQMFQTIDMASGSFAAEYGNRFGGIVDMTTRSGDDLRGHGSIELGGGTFNNSDGFAEYGGTKGRFGYYASASGFTGDWFLNPPEPVQLHDFGFGLRGSMQLDWRGSNDAVSLFFIGGGTNFELPNIADDQEEGRNANRRLRSQTAILNWQHTFSPEALVTTSLYERTVDDRLVPTTDDVTPFADGGRHSLSGGIKTDLLYSRKRHIFKVGVDLTRIRLREHMNFDGRELPTPPEDPEPFSFFGTQLGGQASVYAQDHIQLTPNLTTDVGVRYDYFDLTDTFAQVSPRFSLAWHIPNSRTTLHATYNRFFSPHPLEYSLLAGYFGTQAPDPDDRVGRLKPYRQHYFEAGIAHELSPKVSLEVNGYYHRGDTPFEYREISITRIFLPINSSKASSYGTDFALNLKQLQRVGISARLQYAYQRTFFTGPVAGGFAVGEDIAPGERFLPAFDEPHSGTVMASYNKRWRNFQAGWMVRFGSGTVAFDGAQRLPIHLTGDFNTGIDVWQKERAGLRLEFNVANVSDDRYQIAKESDETPIQYAMPRIVSGRMRITF